MSRRIVVKNRFMIVKSLSAGVPEMVKVKWQCSSGEKAALPSELLSEFYIGPRGVDRDEQLGVLARLSHNRGDARR